LGSTAANEAADLGRAPRILFVPVSGTYGMGEYARSLAIAAGVRLRWRGAAIHFVLSREAPYAADVPFPSTLLASSPTFHSSAVSELIERLCPDIVIFDNAGRSAQLRTARRLGARVVFISARARQRRKAFRYRWMRMIDEHWIAYPEFIAGRLGFLERFKLKVLGRPVVRYLDVILARCEPSRREAVLSRSGCVAGSYVLVVPGGGTGHPGTGDAVGQFLTAARGLAARGVATVYVGPREEGAVPAEAANWHHLGPVPQTDLAELMRSARLIIANGGSTLLQAIACGNACIAVPIAKDQTERTRRCVAAGVAVEARLDSASILKVAEDLLQDEAARRALAQCAATLRLADGVELAVQALDRLLGPAPPVARTAPAQGI
jgi:spore coat polysaccharide biosynthesis predicted glycosyltransferase SpsG